MPVKTVADKLAQSMDDAQLLRYSRQILLPEIGVEGQARLARARVLVVGLGGLGCPAATYLAASGVGTLVVADADRVELSNLQRQVLYADADQGRLKVEAAGDRLRALNPELRVEAWPRRLDPGSLDQVVGGVDLVLDASDNFATRFAVNRACFRARRPLVSAAVIRMEGQVSVFRFDRGTGPCYRCLYAEGPEEPPAPCSESGVLGSVAGMLGALQATEAVKTLLDIGETLHGRLLLLDALRMEWRSLSLPPDPDCPVCGRAGVSAAPG